jgi:hypothetical protein
MRAILVDRYAINHFGVTVATDVVSFVYDRDFVTLLCKLTGNNATIKTCANDEIMHKLI